MRGHRPVRQPPTTQPLLRAGHRGDIGGSCSTRSERRPRSSAACRWAATCRWPSTGCIRSGRGPADHRHRPRYKNDEARASWNRPRSAPPSATRPRAWPCSRGQRRAADRHAPLGPRGWRCRSLHAHPARRGVITSLPEIKVPSIVVGAPKTRRHRRQRLHGRQDPRLPEGGDQRGGSRANIDQPRRSTTRS